MVRKKVFVSGCFDILHSGHIYFLEQAAALGDLYVGLGSDRTVEALKGKYPACNQDERQYMLEALKSVKKCFVNSGSGILDFANEIRELSPDIFVVNEDGAALAKSKLCKELGIQYIVLKRSPRTALIKRSSADIRKICRVPYRLDLAGGWLDQPMVSKHWPGPVLTISIEPTIRFQERSGMASSSRRRAIELWNTAIPLGNKEKLAKLLFSFENPPGSGYFSGSQDAIGIVFSGLNKLDYDGRFWPEKISSVHNEKILDWLEQHLYLIPLGPRPDNFEIKKKPKITAALARTLASASLACWESILRRDLTGFGQNLRRSFEAQVALFPDMKNKSIAAVIKKHASESFGWKLSGAGGGGYLVLARNKNARGSVRIKIRREMF
jgi:cytidyltransferase-like protein